MNLCALIMAGGKGTRFWPLSTDEKPKQFLPLIEDRTMIQMTIDRIIPIIPIERVFVCTGERYLPLIKKQIPNLPERNIIIEPEGRNTAPCITLSALVIKKYYNDSTMVVLPADHLIKNEEKFRELVVKGSNFLNERKDGILTLGMEPDRPETGYGYINYGENVDIGIKEVKKFVEKPNIDLAKSYLAEGTYLWNSGMFLWNTNHIINEVKKFKPSIYETLKNIEVINDNSLQKYINENYSKTESISIDYAVLEKSDNIYVIPTEIGWDDIGTWEAIDRYKDKDSNKNIKSGKVVQFDSFSNIVISSDKPIILDEVKDLYIIETETCIIVGKRENMDRIKDIKERI